MRSYFARRGALLLSIAAFAGGSACSSLGPKIQPPEVTLLSVAMTSADMFSQNFVVRVLVKNPNDRELAVKEIDYHVFLGGDDFAEGETTLPLTVPALGEKEFEMPVRTNFVSSLGRLLSRVNGQKKVGYVVEGTVKLQSGMLRKVPFRQSGEVDLALKK